MLAEIESSAAWWVAAIDYECGAWLEPAAAGRQGVRPGRARFWRFARCRQLTPAQAEDWLERASAQQAGEAGIGGRRESLQAEDHARAVARIQEWIEAGDCYQINLTFPIDFCWWGSPHALYRRLRAAQPVRYGGVLCDAPGAIVSLSPELFVERQGNTLLTRPMKGTAPRQSDPEALRGSEKNRAENLMIVDLLRNDLGRLAHPGSVQVTSLFEIEAYPAVWQMVSEVRAELSQKAHLGAIFAALFPCGSVTGAPKIRAMQCIAEVEPAPRGIYTGSLGWFAPHGDFRLNVAIRTLDLAPGGAGRMGVGSGIVADSDAGEEWRECRHKAVFLDAARPAVQLIETLRRENGHYPRLALHLARLRASATWLGFPCDEAAWQTALAGVEGEALQRVRLALSPEGRLDLAVAPLAELPATLFAEWAALPIASDYPLRRHKTSDRAAYDAALQAIATCPQVFDRIFLNERGEVAEGARSNVFVEREGILLTPPLQSGALPGVLRAELLATGRAREAVLWPADLAGPFWLGNALRGLLPVSLISP